MRGEQSRVPCFKVAKRSGKECNVSGVAGSPHAARTPNLPQPRPKPRRNRRCAAKMLAPNAPCIPFFCRIVPAARRVTTKPPAQPWPEDVHRSFTRQPTALHLRRDEPDARNVKNHHQSSTTKKKHRLPSPHGRIPLVRGCYVWLILDVCHQTYQKNFLIAGVEVLR